MSLTLNQVKCSLPLYKVAIKVATRKFTKKFKAFFCPDLPIGNKMFTKILNLMRNICFANA